MRVAFRRNDVAERGFSSRYRRIADDTAPATAGPCVADDGGCIGEATCSTTDTVSRRVSGWIVSVAIAPLPTLEELVMRPASFFLRATPCFPCPGESGRSPRSVAWSPRHGPLCLVLITLLGCATRPADQPEIAPVSGRVTLDGRPLGNVKVVFQSHAGAISFASTAPDGTYELTYIRSAKGAGLGRNVVRISTPTDGPTGPKWKDPIPAVYNTASTLEADVVKGRNVCDFALVSKPSPE